MFTTVRLKLNSNLAIAGTLLLIAGPVFGQPWPAKNIVIISENNVGSIGDTALRLSLFKLAQGLGQQVVIENRPGAQGAVAAGVVKRASADGYTLFYCSSNGLINARFLVKNLPFDTFKDFVPITAVASTPSFIVISTTVPANNLREFVDYARRNPGKLQFGSTGMGSTFHLYGEAFYSLNK